MEIFRKGIKFNTLAEIYVGFKLKLITIDEVINLIESNKVTYFKAEDYSRLIKNKDSNIKFNREFQEIIRIGNINQNDDFTNKEPQIPSNITRIWELECLLEKINKYDFSTSNYKSKILDDVYELFYFFNYPDKWSLSKFLLYSMNNNGKSLNQNQLYDNLLLFINKEIIFFKKK
ncbi:MAG: hypothetical protein ACWIPJ_06790 [Polaribacter sp.]